MHKSYKNLTVNLIDFRNRFFGICRMCKMGVKQNPRLAVVTDEWPPAILKRGRRDPRPKRQRMKCFISLDKHYRNWDELYPYGLSIRKEIPSDRSATLSLRPAAGRFSWPARFCGPVRLLCHGVGTAALRRRAAGRRLPLFPALPQTRAKLTFVF